MNPDSEQQPERIQTGIVPGILKTCGFFGWVLIALALIAVPCSAVDGQNIPAGMPGGCSPAGGKNTLDSGYVSENYTLELIGNDQVHGLNTENMSWDIIRKFYAGYGSNLTSRWAGFAKNDSAPMSAYVFRVLPDGSTISYIDYGSGPVADTRERVRYWEDTVLANETARLLHPGCPSPDTARSVTEQGSTPVRITHSTVFRLYEPYGRTTVSQEIFWTRQTTDDREYFVSNATLTLVTGEELRNDRMITEPGRDGKKFSFIQSTRNITPVGPRDLPGVVLYDWRTETPQTPVPQICLEFGGWKITLPFALYSSQEEIHTGSDLGKWVKWDADFHHGMFDSPRPFATLSTATFFHCDKERARSGEIYSLIDSRMDPGDMFPKTGPSDTSPVGTTVIAVWISSE